MVEWSMLGKRAHFCQKISGGNYHFLVINNYNPGRGQTPPPSWQCQDFGNIWSPTPSLNPYCRLVFYPCRFSFFKGGGDHFHSKIFHFRRILTIERLYTMRKKTWKYQRFPWNLWYIFLKGGWKAVHPILVVRVFPNTKYDDSNPSPMMCGLHEWHP